MSQHPIEGLMDVTLEKIKSMVDSNTIIGNPINMADGTLVLPISKVTFGFASGGADFPSKTTKDLFGGGGGAGVSIQPVAFLVVKDGSVRMLQLADTSNSVDRAIGMLPDMVDKITALFNNKQKEQQAQGVGHGRAGLADARGGLLLRQRACRAAGRAMLSGPRTPWLRRFLWPGCIGKMIRQGKEKERPCAT